jgi:ribulose-5-phosphate 4-epimerase/fuculose-1-phosphate aldolase
VCRHWRGLTLPLLPYYAPGDPAPAEIVGEAATEHHARLLSNHGPIVSGSTLLVAADVVEELEATASLWLRVRHFKAFDALVTPWIRGKVFRLYERIAPAA